MGTGSPLTLPDAEVSYRPRFLSGSEADRTLAYLRANLRWRSLTIRMRGREVRSPRLSAWYGDPGIRYTYSGLTLEARGWDPMLEGLRDRLERELGLRFNGVLANYYRNGQDSMGWHADNEPELGPEPVIASLSLGETRRFLMKHRRRGERIALELEHGSLLLMTGPTQKWWRHAVPKTVRPVGVRLNLTFRQVQATG